MSPINNAAGIGTARMAENTIYSVTSPMTRMAPMHDPVLEVDEYMKE
jgi:hypothetical protein